MSDSKGKLSKSRWGDDSRQDSWRAWYSHGLMPTYMRDVGTYPLLTPEEEEEWARQYREARERIQEILQEHPQVIIHQLRELRDSPDRKKLSNYLMFSRRNSSGEELPGEEELSDLDPQILNSILDNSISFIRDCTRQKSAKREKGQERDSIRSIAEIIAPYLRSTGKVHFQQRFYADCVEFFIHGDWEESGLSAAELEEARQEMREARDQERNAMNALVEGNLRLVISVAKHFTNSFLSLPDLVQEGNIGLMRAIETFEWQRGHRLSTFACYRIRQAISQALNSSGRPIRIPTNILRVLTKIRRCEQQFIQQHDMDPTDDQLAELAGISPARLRALRRMEQQPISLQSMATEDRDWNDLLADRGALTGEYAAQEALRDSLKAALDSLKETERDVIVRRFGLEGQPTQTLECIAKIHGLTSERVRQIEVAALLKLRRTYGGQLRGE